MEGPELSDSQSIYFPPILFSHRWPIANSRSHMRKLAATEVYPYLSVVRTMVYKKSIGCGEERSQRKSEEKNSSWKCLLQKAHRSGARCKGVEPVLARVRVTPYRLS